MKSIIRAVVTEKSLKLSENGQYSFVVSPSATKDSVAHEVKGLYHVDPVAVNRVVTKGKVKRRGRSLGTRSTIHKAIVTIKKGQKIAEFSVGE